MRFFKNFLLYISAFVPMYALVFVKLVVELANQNLTFNVLNSINFVLHILLIGLGVLGFLLNVPLNRGQSIEIEILSKHNITDQHFLGYFSLFVFFAIPLDLSLISGFVVYIMILFFIGIVYINNGLYYINPLLNILGFNFYDISYKEKDKDEKRNAKIFYKGELEINNTTYWVNLKNVNFSFVDTHKKSE